MKFPRAQFETFCRHLVLNSKEQGRVPFRWNGAQVRFMDELEKGLAKEQHKAVVCKARQLGITTLTLALDLFWLFRHPGTQGALAVSTESVRDLSRNILTNYVDGLPNGMKVPVKVDNRTEIRFANTSRLAHMIAGGRNSGALARGQGLNYCHMTEMSSWADPEGVVSLDASLAETHPSRLYVAESTARGFNVFHDMWEDAERSLSTNAIFIGWWAKDDYRMPQTSRLWDTYGRAKPSRDERAWATEVKKRYGHEITAEQFAWWRWKWAESGESRLLVAEYPWTAEQAFVMTGDQFFGAQTLKKMKDAALAKTRQCWRYVIGPRFEDTKLERDDDGPLSIFEEPQADAEYVIAADPAYGESEWSDAFCAQVLRCERDRVVQVAEFNSPDCTMYGFAWILAHLAGAYSSLAKPATLIIELGGPGRGVLQELQRMPEQYADRIDSLSESAQRTLRNLFGSIRHYLYRRPDSLSGGRLLQWETTWKTKQIMMNLLRDSLERGMVEVNSPEWPEEARFVTQNGSRIQAEGQHKDDRVVALALGVVAWQQQVLPEILATQAEAGYGRGPGTPLDRAVHNWLDGVRSGADDALWADTGSSWGGYAD